MGARVNLRGQVFPQAVVVDHALELHPRAGLPRAVQVHPALAATGLKDPVSVPLGYLAAGSGGCWCVAYGAGGGGGGARGYGPFS